MKQRLHRLQAADARIGDVRGRGAMIAVELVEPGTDHARSRPDRSASPPTPTRTV